MMAKCWCCTVVKKGQTIFFLNWPLGFEKEQARGLWWKFQPSSMKDGKLTFLMLHSAQKSQNLILQNLKLWLLPVCPKWPRIKKTFLSFLILSKTWFKFFFVQANLVCDSGITFSKFWWYTKPSKQQYWGWKKNFTGISTKNIFLKFN